MVVVLPTPLTPTTMTTWGLAAASDRRWQGLEIGQDLFFQDRFQFLGTGDARPFSRDPLHDVHGGPDTHVRSDQQLFQLLQHVVVNQFFSEKQVIDICGENFAGFGKS